MLASFYAPNTIQSGEYSTDGDMDGAGYVGSWVNQDGNRNFPYVGDDGKCWNSNFNWADNDHNYNWRWLVACNWFSFPANHAGFPLYVAACFCHPPIMRPTSTNCSDNATYFLLSSALLSHATWRKNFRTSSFSDAFLIAGSFCSRERRLAMYSNSRTSLKSTSIFAPKV